MVYNSDVYVTTNDNHDDGTGALLCITDMGAFVVVVFGPVVGPSSRTTPDPEVGIDVGISMSPSFGDVGASVDDTVVGVVVGVSFNVIFPPPTVPNPDVGARSGAEFGFLVGAGAEIGFLVGVGIETGRVLLTGTAMGAKIGGTFGFAVGVGPSTTPNCSARIVTSCRERSNSLAYTIVACAIHKIRRTPRTRSSIFFPFCGDLLCHLL